jgi:DNA polymerase III subunit epsilon
MQFTALDFETANAKRDSACQIGITRVENNRVTLQQSWLINPCQSFQYFNTKIHGITAADVAHEPTFAELWPEIAHHFDGQQVVAHNAGFDISVIKACLETARLRLPQLSYLCSVRVAKNTWFGLPSYKLGALAALHEFEFTAHDAGHDAAACAHVIQKAARYHTVNSLEELAQATKSRLGALNPYGSFQAQAQLPKKGRKIVEEPVKSPYPGRYSWDSLI